MKLHFLCTGDTPRTPREVAQCGDSIIFSITISSR